MHIPGKMSRRHRNPSTRFFRQWATARRNSGKSDLRWASDLLKLPNAQQVAQIAGNARRLAMWQDSCEQANEEQRLWQHNRRVYSSLPSRQSNYRVATHPQPTNMKRTLLTLVSAFALLSCTDAERAKLTGFGNSYKVELYSGGTCVRTWTSSGKVLSEQYSDGYYFNDAVTGKLIEVCGDIVITEL